MSAIAAAEELLMYAAVIAGAVMGEVPPAALAVQAAEMEAGQQFLLQQRFLLRWRGLRRWRR